MKKIGNRMIADGGHYIITSDNRISFAFPFEEGIEYTEYALNDSVFLRPDGSISYGGVFNFEPKEETFNWLKSRFIKRAFDSEEQIAILLSKDTEEMEFLQSWIEWADRMAKMSMFVLSHKEYESIPVLSEMSVDAETFPSESIIMVTDETDITFVSELDYEVVFVVGQGVSFSVPGDIDIEGEADTDSISIYSFNAGKLSVSNL